MTLRLASLPLVSVPRTALILAAVLALAACTSKPAPEPAAATPSTPAAETAPADSNAPAAPTASDTPAPTDAPIAPAATATPPAGPEPVLGTDYTEIAGGQPFNPQPGKIEVAEAFGYTCPHCAEFEPLIEAWRAKQTADVSFVPVAAPFGGFWTPYAKAYYTAEALGLVAKTHSQVFRAIHIERSLPVRADVSPDDIAQFYAKYGANPKEFASTMASFAVDAKVNRARQFLERSGVQGTPSIVVNGKYLVSITQGGFEEMLRVTDHLVAKERAASKGAAAPAPAASGTGG